MRTQKRLGKANLAEAGWRCIGSFTDAMHHAEVVAHRVGEPLGTLILALAVTTIETALILSMMISVWIPRTWSCLR